MKIFAERLRGLRENLGISQLQLGGKIGLCKSQVSAYETDDRDPPIDMLRKIAETFNVSVDYLVGLSDIPDQSYPQRQFAVFNKKTRTVIDLSKLPEAKAEVVKALYEVVLEKHESEKKKK